MAIRITLASRVGQFLTRRGPAGAIAYLICIWLAIGLPITTPGALGADVVPKEEVDRHVRPAVDGQWLQSVVVGLIDERGTQVIGYGQIAPGGRAADGDTLYEIGSVSKTFTLTLLAQMVDDGKLSLDDPVQKFLPADVKVPRTAAGPITLAHLATHRSGLPRMPTNFEPKDPGNPYADYTVAQMYEFVAGYDLPRDPGQTAMYSNLGVGLLGHALALREHKNYEELLVERICKPLKMDATRITLDGALRDRLAPPFNAEGVPDRNWDLPTFAGAGAIRSTANDMLKYIAAEIGVSRAPLTHDMRLTQIRQAKFDAVNDIGLAWFIDTARGVCWHNGQTGGYHSYVAFHPDRKLGVVVLGNNSSDLIDGIGARLMHKLLGEKPEPMKLRQAISVDPKALARYVGDYKLSPLATIKIRQAGGQLTAQLTGQITCRVYPQSETEFFWKAVDAQLTFTVDQAGVVTGAKLHQNSANMPATRLR